MEAASTNPSLEIRRVDVDQRLSPSEFASQFESRNVPAVFNGCVKDWKAFSKWNPYAGGLDYLEEKIGSRIVEAMLSRAAPVFYGDLRSHERVPLPFSTFIGYCKQHIERKYAGQGCSDEFKNKDLEGSSIEQTYTDCEYAPQQMYLAQVSIFNSENKGQAQLEILSEDIQKPAMLGKISLAAINLWMNNAEARSSTHYDPHHNLLCIVSGCKRVALWPPSASPSLYPLPIYGEASNHSAVPLGNIDFSSQPRAEYMLNHCQKVILHAGDALFIPEGWFHQVDSDDLTIAVNFWWQSDIMSSMLGHMDAYYLRRIIRRLTDREMDQMLHKHDSMGFAKSEASCVPNNGLEADANSSSKDKMHLKEGVKEPHEGSLLHDLEPVALRALHELVSTVHERVNMSSQSQLIQSSPTNDSPIGLEHELQNDPVFSLEEDPVAKILWALKPHSLRSVFTVMVDKFPRTLEALMLHLLSPVGAEVFTRKFDEIDKETCDEDRSKFYQNFYGAFDDQFAAMDAILNGKELYAQQALNNVLDKYLGVNSCCLSRTGERRHLCDPKLAGMGT